MTKKHSAKRAVVASLLSLMLCFSMLIGTTFAWFTDSVTSGSNIIQAGNLDIVLEYWDGDSWEDAEGNVVPFVAKDGRDQSEILWEPGCTYNMAPIRVRNAGSLSAKILITISGVTGDSKLLEVVEFKNTINNIPESVLNGSAGNQLQGFEDATIDILYGMSEGNIIFDWSLAPKGETTPGTGHTDVSPEFTISAHMAEEAGNEYMNCAIEGIYFTVIATQQAYESDSFGKWYDQFATFPVRAAATITANSGETPIKAGNVSVIVPEGVDAGHYEVVVTNKKTTVDANDQTTFTADIDLLKDGEKVTKNGQTVYRVAIELEPEKSIVKVMHNGNEISDYIYDPVTGIIKFETDSFSPFEVVYEKDKTVKVSSVEEFLNAVESAAPGAIIDATGVSVDLNSIGSDLPTGKRAYVIPGGITIKGLTTVGSYRGGNYLSFAGSSDQPTILENCSFEPSGRAMGVGFGSYEGGATSIVYNNCTFKGPVILEFVNNPDGSATYNNCTFTKAATGNNYVMANGGTHIFNGCTFDYTGVTQSSMGIINTATVNSTSESDGSNSTVVILDGCTRINCGTRTYGAKSTLTIK